MPLLVSNSRIGIPWITTLNQGVSIWANLCGIIASQIAFFSKRKLAEKLGVVVTTMFLSSNFEIVATTGPLIPLSLKALLKALRSWISEKDL